jgi:hypothetical protein
MSLMSSAKSNGLKDSSTFSYLFVLVLLYFMVCVFGAVLFFGPGKAEPGTGIPVMAIIVLTGLIGYVVDSGKSKQGHKRRFMSII